MSDPDQFFDEDEPFDLERAPLDPPEGPVDRDWGGDGSDPSRPMLPLIRHAFEVDKVDPMLRGSWGDIQQELGVTSSAIDPLVERSRRQHESALAQLRSSMKMANARPPEDARAANQKRKQNKARSEKNKRKAAKASRKANRK